MRVIITVSFATQTNQFRAAEFFLEKIRFSFIVFHTLSSAKARKKIVDEIAKKLSLQCAIPKVFHSCFIVGRKHLYKSRARIMLYKANLYQFLAFQTVQYQTVVKILEESSRFLIFAF